MKIIVFIGKENSSRLIYLATIVVIIGPCVNLSNHSDNKAGFDQHLNNKTVNK